MLCLLFIPKTIPVAIAGRYDTAWPKLYAANCRAAEQGKGLCGSRDFGVLLKKLGTDTDTEKLGHGRQHYAKIRESGHTKWRQMDPMYAFTMLTVGAAKCARQHTHRLKDTVMTLPVVISPFCTSCHPTQNPREKHAMVSPVVKAIPAPWYQVCREFTRVASAVYTSGRTMRYVELPSHRYPLEARLSDQFASRHRKHYL